MTPPITVIVPVYRVEPYIEACLRSVAEQDYPGSLECILVDDASPDGSMKRAAAFIATYTGPVVFRTVIHSQNRGLSAARNSGLEIARGEEIFFLDGDDALLPGALSRLASYLEKEAYDVVVGRFLFPEKALPIHAPFPDGTVLRGDRILKAYDARQWPATACNKLYRSAFLREQGLRFLDGVLHEDELWSFQLAALARSLVISQQETYLYLIREGSITTASCEQRRIASLQRILLEMQQFARKQGLLRNPSAHNRIERFRRNLLLRLQPPEREKAYLLQRNQFRARWRDAFRADGFRLNRQVRDIHLALPPSFGSRYYRFWLQLTSPSRTQASR